MGLTNFLVKKAQASWLAHVVPEDKIPISLQLAELGKEAVIQISDGKNQVLEISGVDIGDLYRYVENAKAYLKQSDYRLSASSSLLSASPGRPTSCHDSLLSPTAETTMAAVSDSVRQKSKKKARPTPTKWERPYSKRYLCSTCGTQITQASDFKKHIKDRCELPPKRFKCGDCSYIADDESVICLHWTATRHSGLLVLPSIDKKAFGCSYCGRCLHSVDTYIACMRKDQEVNENILPWPPFRLRGLLKQSNRTTTSISLACTRRGLHSMDWTRMMWDDANCDRFASQLEYGCNAADDIYGWGVLNLERFVEQVLACAKFEDTGKPVPPPKDVPESGRAPEYAFVSHASSSRAEEYHFNFEEFSNGSIVEQNGMYAAF